MKYKLIALDMDGTVLNEKKELTSEVEQAIHDAIAAGVEVVFCTGRSYAEMKDLLKFFPDMHYLCGESGALIYDIREKKVMERTTFPTDVMEILCRESKGRNLMPVVFSEGECCVSTGDVDRMAEFYMGQYTELYREVATEFPDVMEHMVKTQRLGEKVNYYCGSTELRAELYQIMTEIKLEASFVYSEITSLEFSPLGLDKGVGIRKLCNVCGFKPEEAVMVGDADNDIAGLKAAGLGIAMGNANERVKEVADLIVADNEHAGCAEAIRYVMNCR